MREILRLFDPTGFMARRACGLWTPEMLALHQISDFVIWASYMVIPILLWVAFRHWQRGRINLLVIERFTRALTVEFGLFIFFCGGTHLHQVVVFYWPVYRWIGVWSACTACVSVLTVLTMAAVLGLATARPSGSDLLTLSQDGE